MEARRFDDEPAVVTVGLVTGGTETGRIAVFDPSSDQVSIHVESESDSRRSDVWIHIPMENVVYVAFFRRKDNIPLLPDGVEEYCIQTPGKRTFDVYAVPEQVQSGRGFYAWPLSSVHMYDEMYFFRDRIYTVESKEPFGSMLVRKGELSPSEAVRGIATQLRDRERRIGEILVERGCVNPDAVSEGLERAAALRKQGRAIRLGEVLVEAGLASPEDIEQALEDQKQKQGRRLGELLVANGIVTEEVIAKTLAEKFHVPYVDLDECDIDLSAVAELPSKVITRYRVFPFAHDQESLTVAMDDPVAIGVIDMLRFSVGRNIRMVVVRPSQLTRYIQTYVETEDSSESEEARLLEYVMNEVAEAGGAKDAVSEEEQTAVKLVYQIIIGGYVKGASDIHIEPNGEDRPVLVRYRIDGQCERHRELPPAFRHQLAARIKVMANLDITERRIPQDGKIALQLEDRKVELRVATLPTVTGDEDVVLRILAGGKPLPLAELALNERNVKLASQLTARPYGLVLVVGPTGSGKTTTLHSMLANVDKEHRKIWTAEDPVEIRQEGLRQVQVNPGIGFTFAKAMRAFLRADPDVIMVGEMRDGETASIGVEASLTGHLVFSTLHTGSAPETVRRLIDMGVDAFTFSDALLGVLAQRLARRLCVQCRKPYNASDVEFQELAEHYGEEALRRKLEGEPLVLWRAEGCSECGNRGYKGRVALHELLVNDREIRLAIQRKASVDELRELAVSKGMTTLVQDGIDKCLQGLTDLRQVLAVCAS